MAVPTGSDQRPADQSGGGAKSKKSKAAPPGGTPQPESDEGPWLATRHFFMPFGPPQPVKLSAQPVDLARADNILRCAGDASCRSDLQRLFGLEKEGVPVACLLAIVPDPFHTRLALFTDHSIEGIRKGAVAAGWEFASQWLPWSDAVDPDEGDPEERAKERRYIRAQEAQPGAMVFRRSVRSPDWGTGGLVIFVVGETPTAGVNPGQFQIARAYMGDLCTPGRAADRVKIDGPTFSGSFDSLAFLIGRDQANQPGKIYQVRSGTAQSLYDARKFTNLFGAAVEFHSATADISEEERHFEDVLQELRIPRQRAAVLSEDGTTFGGAAATNYYGPNDRVRTFRFPRDISHLRDAYRQAQQIPKAANAPAPGPDFSLKDPSIGEDSVPTYAQTQTPLSQNGVINEIARAIRRFDIRIVEISATNVLDTLFLAGALRRQCPDTRLLVQSADLLFVQAEQTQPLDGILFLTSYPLFAESKAWDRQKEIAFLPDSLSEGVFYATVLLLSDPAQSGDAAPSKDALRDYGWETQAAPYPPEWLLTLDRRGFSPVKIWDDSGTKDCFAPAGNSARTNWFESVRGTTAQRDFRSLAAPQLWTLLSSAFALLGVVLGIWMMALRRKPDWQVDARFEPSTPEYHWHGFYLLLFLLLLIAIQFGIFTARWFLDDWLHLILMAAGFFLPAGAAIRFCRPGKRLAACLAATVVLAGVAVWSFCCLRPGPQGQLFSFRAAELRFGSSPLWPIVSAAAALLLWCFAHVTRLYLASRGQPDAVTDGVEVLQGHLRKSYHEFKISADSLFGVLPGQRLGFGIALSAFAALCVLSRVDVQLGSIDGLPYDVLSIALPLPVAGLLLLTCWHIHSFWKSLHCFTTNLELLPLASAFIRVSPSGGNRPIWVRRSDLLSLEVHTKSVLVLHDLELLRNGLAGQGLSPAMVGSWHGLYRDQLANLLAVDPSRTRCVLVAEHRNLWQLSKLIATSICKLTLMRDWQSEPLVRKMAAAAGSQTEGLSSTEVDAPVFARQGPSSAPGQPDSILDLAEKFVALHYTPFLLYGVRQIQNLLWFPSIGFVLLMFSMNSYSFQAPQWIGTFLMVLFVVITWTLGRCMVQMERDPILSRVAGTKPGQLGAAFYLRIAQYGALPVLGLLARQFPAISNTLLSGIQPALEALK